MSFATPRPALNPVDGNTSSTNTNTNNTNTNNNTVMDPKTNLKGPAKRMLQAFHVQPNAIQNMATVPTVILESVDGTVGGKQWDLVEMVKIGRQLSPKQPPTQQNGVFDSKVLSRQHAQMWSEHGKVLLSDVGSSNGTFLNGNRLSEEGVTSVAWEVKDGDRLDFGVDILNTETNQILYKRVSLKISILGGVPASATSAKRPSLHDTATTATTDPTMTTTTTATTKEPTLLVANGAVLDSILAILQEEYKKATEKTTDLSKLTQQLAHVQALVEKSKHATHSPATASPAVSPSHVAELEKVRSQLKSTEDSLAQRTKELAHAQKKCDALDVQVKASAVEVQALQTDVQRLQEQVVALLKAAPKDNAEASSAAATAVAPTTTVLDEKKQRSPSASLSEAKRRPGAVKEATSAKESPKKMDTTTAAANARTKQLGTADSKLLSKKKPRGFLYTFFVMLFVLLLLVVIATVIVATNFPELLEQFPMGGDVVSEVKRISLEVEVYYVTTWNQIQASIDSLLS